MNRVVSNRGSSQSFNNHEFSVVACLTVLDDLIDLT